MRVICREENSESWVVGDEGVRAWGCYVREGGVF